MEPVSTKHGKIAFDFATALANSDYTSAHGLLSESLKNEWSSDSLKKEYEEMIEYGEGDVTHIEVMNEMIEWPTKENNDLGWAYVAMSGNDFSEAVAVVICNEKNHLKVREIEWGRP